MDRYQVNEDPIRDGWMVLDTATMPTTVVAVLLDGEATARAMARQLNAKGARRTNHIVRVQRLSEWNTGANGWSVIADGGLTREAAEDAANEILASDPDVFCARIDRAGRHVWERTINKWSASA